ncbi:MAG: YbjN domain-containing protein [Nitriliruptoraceae bacterium]
MVAASPASAREVLLGTLGRAGLDVDEVADHRWTTMLAGEWKRTIPVLLELGDRRLTVTSLFAGVPDEGHAEVYRILLRRNQRSGPVHFALDDEGDLILTGSLPLAALDEASVDELLGRLLETADATYNQVLRTGFASYLAAEQRWRAAAGLPPNPVGSPVRDDRGSDETGPQPDGSDQ